MSHKKLVGKSEKKVRTQGKRCGYRPFPYLKVAKMWQQGKKISAIAHAINRVDKDNPNNDQYHSLRNFLRLMHAGYLNGNGRVVKLPHRISKDTVRKSRKAGLRA